MYSYGFCEESGNVIGVLTLLFGGVAQFHDDRVVELRVQLRVEDVEGKDKEEECALRARSGDVHVARVVVSLVVDAVVGLTLGLIAHVVVVVSVVAILHGIFLCGRCTLYTSRR